MGRGGSRGNRTAPKISKNKNKSSKLYPYCASFTNVSKSKAATFGFKVQSYDEVDNFIDAMNSKASLAAKVSTGRRNYANIVDIYDWLRIDIDDDMKELLKVRNILKPYYYIDLPSTSFDPDDDSKNFKRHIIVKTKGISQLIPGYKEQMAAVIIELGLEFLKDKRTIEVVSQNMNPYKNGNAVAEARKLTTVNKGKSLKLIRVDDSTYPPNSEYSTTKVSVVGTQYNTANIPNPMILKYNDNVVEMSSKSVVNSKSGFVTLGAISDALTAGGDDGVISGLGCPYHNEVHSEDCHTPGYGFAGMDEQRNVYIHCKGSACEDKKPVVVASLGGELIKAEAEEAEVLDDIPSMIKDHSLPVNEILQSISAYNDTNERMTYLKQLKSARSDDVDIPACKSIIKAMIEIRLEKERVEAIERGDATAPDHSPKFPDWGYDSNHNMVYKSTLTNLNFLLGPNPKMMNVKRYFDVILKRPLVEGVADGEASLAMAQIRSEAARKDLPSSIIEHYYDVAIRGDDKNPLLDAVSGFKYKGKGHIKKFADALISDSGTKAYRRDIVKKWLVQCLAAWDAAEQSGCKDAIPKYESVLVLGGSQGAKKTSGLGWLFSKGGMRPYFADGQNLKPSDRDSVKKVTSYGCVELGELDATFKKSDISELKAFLSEQRDEYRVAYGRTEERYKRRTSFCASVNPDTFLNDATGARRFMTIKLKDGVILDMSKINVKALWAEAWKLYLNGERWWVDQELDAETYEQQLIVNKGATSTGVPGDTMLELMTILKSYPGWENKSKKRVSATMLWKYLQEGRIPSNTERPLFLSLIKEAGIHITSSYEIELPKDLVEKIRMQSKINYD